MTPPSLPFLLTLALVSITAAGCATNPLRPDPALDPEMQQLRQRVVDLQREARMNEVEIARLRQQVAELEARGGTSGTRPETRIATTTPPPQPSRPAAPPPAPGRAPA